MTEQRRDIGRFRREQPKLAELSVRRLADLAGVSLLRVDRLFLATNHSATNRSATNRSATIHSANGTGIGPGNPPPDDEEAGG